MKAKLLVTVLALGAFSFNVVAKENYYQNQYGVNLTESEYKFISDFYFEGYQDYINEKDYYDIVQLMDGEIKISTYEDKNDISLFSTSYSTANKSIKISSSCATNCNISITASWINNPIVRSYDLLGSYLNGTSIISQGSSKMIYGDSIVAPTETSIKTNGISATFKLPTSNNKIYFNQTFTANKSGVIYASYQHAKQSITLANSRKYTFSSAGYGGVFLFDQAVKNYYDAMGGVYIQL